jgi:hypothetical protein
MLTHEQLVEELMKRPGVKAEVERLEREEGALLDEQIQAHQAISNSNEAAKLLALRGATKIGTDAIDRGDFTTLENEQDIANLVLQAGERALKKRIVFLSKQLANKDV